MHYLISVSLIALIPHALLAQNLPWAPLVYDTDVENPVVERRYSPAVVVDPADPKGESWYAFIPGYLWHTSDMGITVRDVSEMGRDNQITSDLAVAHKDPDILYLATGINRFYPGRNRVPSSESVRFEGNGIYRSADRGETWTRLPFFVGVDAGSDLYILNSIATSAEGDTVIVTTRRRILRSIDHGQTWEAAINDLPIVNAQRSPYNVLDEHAITHTQIYHHPESMRHLFVTASGLGANWNQPHLYVLVSHDGGGSWNYLRIDDHPPTLTPGVEDYVTWDFAADPKDPKIFWAQVYRKSYRDAGLHPRQIHRSADGGQTWTEVPVIPKDGAQFWAGNDDPSESFHVHPTNSDTLMLDFSFNHYRNGELLSRGHQNFTRIYFFNEYPDAYRGYRAVAEAPFRHRSRDGLAYTWRIAWIVNDFGAGRSFSSGTTLPLHPYITDVCTTPIPDGVHRSHRYVADTGLVWLARGGVYLNRGWRVQTSIQENDSPPPNRAQFKGTPVPGQHGQFSADIHHPLYGGRRLHCHPHRYDILAKYQSSWSENRGDLRYRRYHTHPDTTRFLSTVSDPTPTSISFSRKQPDRVWLGGRRPVFPSNALMYSEDYMTPGSFTRVTTYPESAPHSALHAHDADADVVYTEVAVTRDAGKTWTLRDIDEKIRMRYYDRVVSHPTNPAVIYSCSAENGLREWGNYLALNRLIAPRSEYGQCRDLFIFPHAPDRMWMGTDSGIWETWDRGKSWTRQNRGLPNLPIVRIYLAHDGKEILVSVFGRGLFTLDATEVDAMLVSTDYIREIPDNTTLLTNYPNPFTNETTLQFAIAQPSHVRLDVYDVLGRRVITAIDQHYDSGVHQVHWDGNDLPSGVYFVRMERDGLHVGVQKVMRR